jgi:hypothetical protein
MKWPSMPDRDGKPIGTTTAYVRAGAGDAEFFDPTMHEAPLRRIADETGGRFYTPGQRRGTSRGRQLRGPRSLTSVEERELWNMPIILIMLVGWSAPSGDTGAPWGCPDASRLSARRRRACGRSRAR